MWWCFCLSSLKLFFPLCGPILPTHGDADATAGGAALVAPPCVATGIVWYDRWARTSRHHTSSSGRCRCLLCEAGEREIEGRRRRRRPPEPEPSHLSFSEQSRATARRRDPASFWREPVRPHAHNAHFSKKENNKDKS
jgi:hypothetical protein